MNSNSISRRIWIEAGYLSSTAEAPHQLKVEALARSLKRNKSAFYYLFDSPEGFVEELLHEHRRRVALLLEAESRCTTFDPELVEVLLTHADTLLFHRQLLIHQQQPAYRQLLQESEAQLSADFLRLWSRELGLEASRLQAMQWYQLASAGFFMALSRENLRRSWLLEQLGQVKQLARQQLALNGGVQ